MAIGRGSMRQQITKGPQKRKFIKKRRVRIIQGNKNKSKSRLFTRWLHYFIIITGGFMTKLCPRGKAAAKRKFKVYPSAYANAYACKVCGGKA